MKNYIKNIAIIFLLIVCSILTNAQTVSTLINEDFESTNGFTLVNGAQTNKWYRGTAEKKDGSYGLYISNNSGTSNAYSDVSSIVHAYKDITIPAGETNIMLYFNYKCYGEPTYDDLKVYIGTTSTTVSAGSAPSGGSVALLATKSPETTTMYISYLRINSSWAGQTVRLIFSWRNDGALNAPPPACIDNIRLYSSSSNGVWFGGYNTSFSEAHNWSDDVAPSSTTDMYIPANSPRDIKITGDVDVSCKNLTIASGATLIVESDATVGTPYEGTLNIYGNLVVDGNLSHTGSTYIYLCGTSKTISGSGDFFYGNICPLHIGTSSAGAATYTLNSSIKISHLTINSASTLTISVGNTLSTAYFFQEGNCTLNGTLEILGPAYSNSSGLAWAAPASPSANPYFTSAKLTLGASSTIKYCSGAYTALNSKFYSYGGNTDYYMAAVNQTIQTLTYNNLSIATNNTKTVTFGSSVIVSGNMTIDNPSTAGGILTTANAITLNGNLILGNGGNGFTFNLGNRIARSTGSGSGTFTMQDNDNISLNVTYADLSNSAIALGASGANTTMTFYGTVTYNSASAQKIMGNSYKNLTLASGGTKSLIANTTVSNNLTQNAGTLALSTYTLAVTGASDINSTLTISTGTYDANGAFDATGGTIDFTDAGFLKIGSTVASLGTLDELAGTVSYDKAGTQNILADNYYNLTIDGSNTKTALSTINVAGELSLDAGTYAIGSTTTTVTGLTDVNSTLTISTGTLDANNTFDATGGTIDFTDAGFLNLGGATVTSLGTLDNAAGTVSYDYAGSQTVLLDNYYCLKIDGSGTKTLGGAIDVDGNLLLSAGTLAVSGSNYAISLAGDWVNAGGSFTYGTGTVTLDGGTQRINVTTAGGTTPLNSDFTFYNVIVNSSDAKFYYNQVNDRKINSNNFQINSTKSAALISN